MDQPFKVLHVVASLAPRHGGPTEAALGMVRALRSEGVDASILSSDDDVGGTLDVPLNEWTQHEGAPVWFIPRVRAKQHSLVGFTYAPGFKTWLKQYLSGYDFAHVHTVFSHPANVAMRAAQSFSVPYAVRPLGQLCRWSLGQRSFIKHLQLALFTRRNVNGAAFIHTTSCMEAEETSGVGFTSPCKILPLGLDMPPVIANARAELRAELGVPQDRIIVIFMSRIHQKKGIELLLDACAQLSGRAFDLVLAGTGDEKYITTLKEQITSLKLDARVRWFGFATGERKWRLMQGADLFVLPSYSENFGIAVAEALACGLPVIISDQVALCDEVSEYSLGRVVPTNPKTLATALASLLDSASERVVISQRARAVAAERFGWPSAAKRLIAAYDEVLSARKILSKA